MSTVDIHEAQSRLLELVDAAALGDDVVIVESGRPVARLVSTTLPHSKRRPGSMKGKIWIADDFDAPLSEDILAVFEGK